MATTPEQLPHPHIPHIRLPDIKGAGRWVQDKWMPVSFSLAVAALSLTGYFIATHDGGTQNPVRLTTEVSNPSKPAEPGSNVAIPVISTETPVPPTATAAPSPEPPEPPITPGEPTAEAIKPSDCGGILSLEACALLRPSYRINPDGSRQLLGFVGNLPIDTKVFADIPGEFKKTKDPDGKPIGILSYVEGQTRKSTTISGQLTFTGRKTDDGREINETITTPGETPIAVVSAPPDGSTGNNFSVAINESEVSTAQTRVDMERVNRYFPDLKTRTPYSPPVPSGPAPTPGVIVTNVYR